MAVGSASLCHAQTLLVPLPPWQEASPSWGQRGFTGSPGSSLKYPRFQPLYTTHGSNSLFPMDCLDVSWKQSDFPSLSSLPAAGEVKFSSAPSFL